VSPFSLFPEPINTANQLDFALPEEQDFPGLIALLQNNFNVRPHNETVSHRIFYDTFDWLLYNNGAVLEVHEDEQCRKVYWRENKNAKLRIQLGISQVPHRASELPESEFRKQLQSVISVRELIPRIKIKIKRLPLTIVDTHEKVVVRIYLDEHWYYPSKTRAGSMLGRRVTVKPVKGFREAYEKVENFFLPMDLRSVQDNMLKLALAESGISTTEYSTKLNLFLDLDMPAEEAMKAILLRLLEIMQQNTAGAIKGTDTEFMHDYRVAIRKTRSALAQIRQVLPDKILADYKNFFSGLSKLTTPVRDLDVFMIKLDSYQRHLKKSEKDDLRPLHQYLLQARADAQKDFVHWVKSADYHESIRKWREYLENNEPAMPPLENSATPIHKLSNKLIRDLYQLAMEEGNAITDTSEAAALHELRKTCKKLRYIMEFFQSLYPAREILELIEALKVLQDNLGDFNDFHVHSGILSAYTEQSSNVDTVHACNKLIKVLEKKQIKTRSKFAQSYTAFSDINTQNEFKELFADSRQAQE
jgi:CHAD domain-containing protein